MRTDRIMSGWCETAHHERCSHLIRPARVTPKKVELCDVWCNCKCHKEATRVR